MQRPTRFLASNLCLYVIRLIQALPGEDLLHKCEVFTLHTTLISSRGLGLGQQRQIMTLGIHIGGY